MNVKGLFLEELKDFFESMNLPKYRAEQVFFWIYQKQVCQWEEMTNLPKNLRQILIEKTVSLGCLALLDQTVDKDGTVKYLFEMEDGNTVESVFIPEEERYTVCLSTQAGCNMGCIFCATGTNGLTRNLTASEILDQLLRIARFTGCRVNHVVIMGQGEPFANYEQTIKAVKIMNDPRGIGIGARHITISTCGIIPGIKRLIGEPLQVNLAISLHAADDELREYLMPVNRAYPLKDLMEAVRNYINNTSRRVTFEYTMIDGVNDREEDLQRLIQLLSGMLCHVNLIPLNPVVGSVFRRSKPERVRLFMNVLNQAHIETTIRKERGSNLAAACGQLQAKRLELK